MKSLLEAERGELTALDNEVLESLRQQEIDHLLSHHWERLVEIQEIQMESINDARNHTEQVVLARLRYARNRNPRED